MNRALLKVQLVKHEGLRRMPYRCTAGKWTIGVGRNLDDKGLSVDEQLAIFGQELPRGEWMRRLLDDGITDAHAAMLLDHDIDQTIAALDTRLPWWPVLGDVRQRVLIDMGFNLGVPGLVKFTHTLAAVRDARWDDAAAGMLASLWARQVGARATRLAEMMRTGREAS
jgi:lysozyme